MKHLRTLAALFGALLLAAVGASPALATATNLTNDIGDLRHFD